MSAGYKFYSYADEIIGLHSITTINENRLKNGLEEIRRGYRDCLRCDKEFFSLNLKSNKMCPKCGGYGANNNEHIETATVPRK